MRVKEWCVGIATVLAVYVLADSKQSQTMANMANAQHNLIKAALGESSQKGPSRGTTATTGSAMQSPPTLPSYLRRPIPPTFPSYLTAADRQWIQWHLDLSRTTDR